METTTLSLHGMKVELLENPTCRAGQTRIQRLYRCPNGLSLGAVRGGPVDLAGDESWEVVVFDERGIVTSDSTGFVPDETLATIVGRLAQWDMAAA
jgi:hypothetical protein